MNAISLSLILCAELFAVTGQILLKLAMNQKNSLAPRRAPRLFFTAIAAQTVGFAIWIGLMPKFNLSYLYPFEGLSRIMLAVAAALFLKEKMTPRLWLGVLLISFGVILVSKS